MLPRRDLVQGPFRRRHSVVRRKVGRTQAPVGVCTATGVRAEGAQALLERAVVLGRADEVRQCARREDIDVMPSIERAALAERGGGDLLRPLLRHPSASSPRALARMLAGVLARACTGRAVEVVRTVVEERGNAPVEELTAVEVTAAFQAVGGKRFDLYDAGPTGGYALAAALLSGGSPLPNCAFFDPPRLLTSEEEEELREPGFPGHRIGLQGTYRDARKRLTLRRQALLAYVGGWGLPHDLLCEVAAFIPCVHRGPFLAGRRRGKAKK
eukprot:Hpha_TRINITY_DN9298_c0_g1::TRINITY_DN9298_c0_g1_i1::g.28713::m.28713